MVNRKILQKFQARYDNPGPVPEPEEDDSEDLEDLKELGFHLYNGQIVPTRKEDKKWQVDIKFTDLQESDPKPWEHQLGEPMNWYNRFVAYLLLPPERRSARHTYEEILIKAGQLKRGEHWRGDLVNWAFTMAKWQWGRRAEAWDIENNYNAIAAEEAKRREVVHEHQDILEGMREVARTWLYERDEEGNIIYEMVIDIDGVERQQPRLRALTDKDDGALALRIIGRLFPQERVSYDLPAEIVSLGDKQLKIRYEERLEEYRIAIEGTDDFGNGDEGEEDADSEDSETG